MVQPIRRVPQEELPGIEPLFFQQLDHRITQTRLEHEPLPDDFMICEDEQAGGALVFRGERYDLNLTLFRPRLDEKKRDAGSGVFVVSNGAGLATNTVDQLSISVPIAGMLDLKQDFSETKIAAALEMVCTVRPDVDALVINMISGIAIARDTVGAVERFCASVRGRVPVVLRFTGPDFGENEAILREFERTQSAVRLANSTRDLVDKTIRLFGFKPDSPRPGRGWR